MSQIRGLGKGLSALMGGDEIIETINKKTNEKNIVNNSEINNFSKDFKLPIDKLSQCEFQPRKNFSEKLLSELSESIKKNGIIQPIIVREKDHYGKYQIIAGERRWRAAKIVGLKEVPVIVKKFTDQEVLETALIENIQREDLTIIEEAEGLKLLMEKFSYTQETLAQVIGKSRSHIANMLRILSLPNEIKEMVNQNVLSMGHARALIGIDNNIELAKNIAHNGLNVRQTEKLVNKNNTSKQNNKKKKNEINYIDEDLIVIENSLEETLGLKVKIEDTKEGGKVSVYFNNLSQLDTILQKLSYNL